MKLKHSRILIDSATAVGYSPAVAPFGRPLIHSNANWFTNFALPCALAVARGVTHGGATLQAMTQELIAELRDWIDYNPETGVLTWSKARPRSRAGSECGTTCHGYRVFHFNGKTHSAHRVAWALHYGSPPPSQIDHINRDKSDNRIQNLRAATNSENNRNKRMRLDNTSGAVGVRWYPPSSKWVAQVVTMGETITKYFSSRPEAIEWAVNKRAELHGEFAAQH